MNYNFKRKIPTPEEIISQIPLSENLKKIKEKRDKEIKRVFRGEDDRFILIIGPCSADNEDAVCKYIEMIASVQEKVKDKIIIIPRIYTNKPRTTGIGYKGMVHQPDPNKEPDLVKGILAIRNMHIRAISESYLTPADEMLYPENYTYLSDLLSYVAIGARSVENQQHRLTVSGMDVPVGMKNPTSGDFSVMLNSIVAAQSAHSFIYNRYEVETKGNNYAHAILRGSVDMYGTNIPNYHYEDLIRLSNEYQKRELKNMAVIVDTNHSNSNKKYHEQPRIANEIIQNMNYSKELKSIIKGFMIESYIEEGSQTCESNIFGKSITDSCLGFKESEKLIYNIAERL